MSGAFRTTVILLAVIALGLGAYDLSNPYRYGMFGYDNAYYTSNGDTVTGRIYPGSPAMRAGVRPGDRLLRSRLAPRQLFDRFYRRAGQLAIIDAQRNGKTFPVRIVTAPYKDLKPIEEGPLGFFILLVTVATALIIALRGAVTRREVRILSLFFIIYALGMSFAWLGDVATTTTLAFVGNVLSTIATLGVAYLLLLFIADFPPIRSPLRTAIGRIALPLTATALLIQAWSIAASSSFPGLVGFTVAGVMGPQWLGTLMNVIILLLLIAGALDGLVRSEEEHRVQMRWVATAIVMSAAAYLATDVTQLLAPNPPPWAAWVTLFQDVPLLALAYAVLRHRLVDLSIVVSRAAVFGFVSVLVVALFLVLEWTATQILERTLGGAAAGGLPGQAIRLALALAVGFSVRPIHATVERYLNKVFFARRAQALAAIQRFALEADVVRRADSLLRLTYDCLHENVDATYAGIYVARGRRYERAYASREDLPHALGDDDAAIVRLRRWNDPFEMDASAHSLKEALLVPMTVRGSLLGVLVCGPKRERTHYLREEIDALAQLSHRVATAYVLLQQDNQPALAPAVLSPA